MEVENFAAFITTSVDGGLPKTGRLQQVISKVFGLVEGCVLDLWRPPGVGQRLIGSPLFRDAP